MKKNELWLGDYIKTTHGSTHSGSTVVSLIYKNHFLKKNKN